MAVHLVAEYTSGDWPKLYSLLLLLSWLRGLTSFRTFRGTRYFIKMVEEVLLDMKNFLILLVYCCLAYSFLFHTTNDMDHFYESLFIGFALSLGDFDKADFSNSAVYILFAAGSLIILIVMMNLLIAIISDSFDRI